MEYSVRLGSGEVVESTERGSPVQYLHGAGMLLPSLEAELEDIEEGMRRTFVIAARDAYGERDESNVVTLPRALFPDNLDVSVGAKLAARTNGGETIPLAVREVFEDRVVVDMNHPLAGHELHFDVTVHEVRAAGTVEVFTGHPRSIEVV